MSVVVSDEDPFDFDQPPEKEEPSSGEAKAPPARRQVPGGPASRSEGALGLQMAKLFGVSPQSLAAPKKPAADRPSDEEPASADPAGEPADSGGSDSGAVSES